MLPIRNPLQIQDSDRLGKRIEKDEIINQKKSGVTISNLNKLHLRTRFFRDKEEYYIVIKGIKFSQST